MPNADDLKLPQKRIVARNVTDVPISGLPLDKRADLIHFKAQAFAADRKDASWSATRSYTLEYKGIKPDWDPNIGINGGWRCPPGSRYGGYITDKYGRGCGSSIVRRLGDLFGRINQPFPEVERDRRTSGASVVRRNAARARRRRDGLNATPVEDRYTPSLARAIRREGMSFNRSTFTDLAMSAPPSGASGKRKKKGSKPETPSIVSRALDSLGGKFSTWIDRVLEGPQKDDKKKKKPKKRVVTTEKKPKPKREKKGKEDRKRPGILSRLANRGAEGFERLIDRVLTGEKKGRKKRKTGKEGKQKETTSVKKTPRAKKKAVSKTKAPATPSKKKAGSGTVGGAVAMIEQIIADQGDDPQAKKFLDQLKAAINTAAEVELVLIEELLISSLNDLFDTDLGLLALEQAHLAVPGLTAVTADNVLEVAEQLIQGQYPVLHGDDLEIAQTYVALRKWLTAKDDNDWQQQIVELDSMPVLATSTKKIKDAIQSVLANLEEHVDSKTTVPETVPEAAPEAAPEIPPYSLIDVILAVASGELESPNEQLVSKIKQGLKWQIDSWVEGGYLFKARKHAIRKWLDPSVPDASAADDPTPPEDVLAQAKAKLASADLTQFDKDFWGGQVVAGFEVMMQMTAAKKDGAPDSVLHAQIRKLDKFLQDYLESMITVQATTIGQGETWKQELLDLAKSAGMLPPEDAMPSDDLPDPEIEEVAPQPPDVIEQVIQDEMIPEASGTPSEKPVEFATPENTPFEDIGPGGVIGGIAIGNDPNSSLDEALTLLKELSGETNEILALGIDQSFENWIIAPIGYAEAELFGSKTVVTAKHGLVLSAVPKTVLGGWNSKNVAPLALKKTVPLRKKELKTVGIKAQKFVDLLQELKQLREETGSPIAVVAVGKFVGTKVQRSLLIGTPEQIKTELRKIRAQNPENFTAAPLITVDAKGTVALSTHRVAERYIISGGETPLFRSIGQGLTGLSDAQFESVLESIADIPDLEIPVGMLTDRQYVEEVRKIAPSHENDVWSSIDGLIEQVRTYEGSQHGIAANRASATKPLFTVEGPSGFLVDYYSAAIGATIKKWDAELFAPNGVAFTSNVQQATPAMIATLHNALASVGTQMFLISQRNSSGGSTVSIVDRDRLRFLLDNRLIELEDIILKGEKVIGSARMYTRPTESSEVLASTQHAITTGNLQAVTAASGVTATEIHAELNDAFGFDLPLPKGIVIAPILGGTYKPPAGSIILTGENAGSVVSIDTTPDEAPLKEYMDPSEVLALIDSNAPVTFVSNFVARGLATGDVHRLLYLAAGAVTLEKIDGAIDALKKQRDALLVKVPKSDPENYSPETKQAIADLKRLDYALARLAVIKSRFEKHQGFAELTADSAEWETQIAESALAGAQIIAAESVETLDELFAIMRTADADYVRDVFDSSRLLETTDSDAHAPGSEINKLYEAASAAVAKLKPEDRTPEQIAKAVAQAFEDRKDAVAAEALENLNKIKQILDAHGFDQVSLGGSELLQDVADTDLESVARILAKRIVGPLSQSSEPASYAAQEEIKPYLAALIRGLVDQKRSRSDGVQSSILMEAITSGNIPGSDPQPQLTLFAGETIPLKNGQRLNMPDTIGLMQEHAMSIGEPVLLYIARDGQQGVIKVATYAEMKQDETNIVTFLAGVAPNGDIYIAGSQLGVAEREKWVSKFGKWGTGGFKTPLGATHVFVADMNGGPFGGLDRVAEIADDLHVVFPTWHSNGMPMTFKLGKAEEQTAAPFASDVQQQFTELNQLRQSVNNLEIMFLREAMDNNDIRIVTTRDSVSPSRISMLMRLMNDPAEGDAALAGQSFALIRDPILGAVRAVPLGAVDDIDLFKPVGAAPNNSRIIAVNLVDPDTGQRSIYMPESIEAIPVFDSSLREMNEEELAEWMTSNGMTTDHGILRPDGRFVDIAAHGRLGELLDSAVDGKAALVTGADITTGSNSPEMVKLVDVGPDGAVSGGKLDIRHALTLMTIEVQQDAQAFAGQGMDVVPELVLAYIPEYDKHVAVSKAEYEEMINDGISVKPLARVIYLPNGGGTDENYNPIPGVRVVALAGDTPMNKVFDSVATPSQYVAISYQQKVSGEADAEMLEMELMLTSDEESYGFQQFLDDVETNMTLPHHVVGINVNQQVSPPIDITPLGITGVADGQMPYFDTEALDLLGAPPPTVIHDILTWSGRLRSLWGQISQYGELDYKERIAVVRDLSTGQIHFVRDMDLLQEFGDTVQILAMSELVDGQDEFDTQQMHQMFATSGSAFSPALLPAQAGDGEFDRDRVHIVWYDTPLMPSQLVNVTSYGVSELLYDEAVEGVPETYPQFIELHGFLSPGANPPDSPFDFAVRFSPEKTLMMHGYTDEKAEAASVEVKTIANSQLSWYQSDVDLKPAKPTQTNQAALRKNAYDTWFDLGQVRTGDPDAPFSDLDDARTAGILQRSAKRIMDWAHVLLPQTGLKGSTFDTDDSHDPRRLVRLLPALALLLRHAAASGIVDLNDILHGVESRVSFTGYIDYSWIGAVAYGLLPEVGETPVGSLAELTDSVITSLADPETKEQFDSLIKSLMAGDTPQDFEILVTSLAREMAKLSVGDHKLKTLLLNIGDFDADEYTRGEIVDAMNAEDGWLPALGRELRPVSLNEASQNLGYALDDIARLTETEGQQLTDIAKLLTGSSSIPDDPLTGTKIAYPGSLPAGGPLANPLVAKFASRHLLNDGMRRLTAMIVQHENALTNGDPTLAAHLRKAIQVYMDTSPALRLAHDYDEMKLSVMAFLTKGGGSVPAVPPIYSAVRPAARRNEPNFAAVPRHSQFDGTVLGSVGPDGTAIAPHVPISEKISSVDLAIAHVEQGGLLSEVPDDFLVRAIVANMGPGKRFLPDSSIQSGYNNSFLGTFGFFDTTQPLKTREGYRRYVVKDPSQNPSEHIQEVLGAALAHELGMPAVGIRLGSDQQTRAVPSKKGGGLAAQRPIVMEHVGNLFDLEGWTVLGHIGLDKPTGTDFGPDSLAQMVGFNRFVNHYDRTAANFIVVRDPEGRLHLMAIDNGNAFYPFGNESSSAVEASDTSEAQFGFVKSRGYSLQFFEEAKKLSKEDRLQFMARLALMTRDFEQLDLDALAERILSEPNWTDEERSHLMSRIQILKDRQESLPWPQLLQKAATELGLEEEEINAAIAAMSQAGFVDEDISGPTSAFNALARMSSRNKGATFLWDGRDIRFQEILVSNATLVNSPTGDGGQAAVFQLRVDDQARQGLEALLTEENGWIQIGEREKPMIPLYENPDSYVGITQRDYDPAGDGKQRFLDWNNPADIKGIGGKGRLYQKIMPDGTIIQAFVKNEPRHSFDGLVTIIRPTVSDDPDTLVVPDARAVIDAALTEVGVTSEPAALEVIQESALRMMAVQLYGHVARGWTWDQLLAKMQEKGISPSDFYVRSDAYMQPDVRLDKNIRDSIVRSVSRTGVQHRWYGLDGLLRAIENGGASSYLRRALTGFPKKGQSSTEDTLRGSNDWSFWHFRPRARLVPKDISVFDVDDLDDDTLVSLITGRRSSGNDDNDPYAPSSFVPLEFAVERVETVVTPTDNFGSITSHTELTEATEIDPDSSASSPPEPMLRGNIPLSRGMHFIPASSFNNVLAKLQALGITELDGVPVELLFVSQSASPAEIAQKWRLLVAKWDELGWI